MTGHTYSGTSLVMGQGRQIQGDLGAPAHNARKNRNLYSGQSTISGSGVQVQGSVNDPQYLSTLLNCRDK